MIWFRWKRWLLQLLIIVVNWQILAVMTVLSVKSTTWTCLLLPGTDFWDFERWIPWPFLDSWAVSLWGSFWQPSCPEEPLLTRPRDERKRRVRRTKRWTKASGASGGGVRGVLVQEGVSGHPCPSAGRGSSSQVALKQLKRLKEKDVLLRNCCGRNIRYPKSNRPVEPWWLWMYGSKGKILGQRHPFTFFLGPGRVTAPQRAAPQASLVSELKETWRDSVG